MSGDIDTAKNDALREVEAFLYALLQNECLSAETVDWLEEVREKARAALALAADHMTRPTPHRPRRQEQ